MNNISMKLNAFLKATGVRQCELAKLSGVSTATINRLIKGVQVDTKLSTATSIYSAMDTLLVERQKQARIFQEHNNASLCS